VRRPARARPDINVTPLVDVVLVLLIIFMVIIPAMEAGAQVRLPGVLHPDPVTKTGTPVTVSVTASGTIYLEKSPVAPERLVTELRRVRAASPHRRVVVKGDRDARYGAVRAVFRECQGVGFPGVSLQTGDRRGAAQE
jgi:biopolymer transport protein TolR